MSDLQWETNGDRPSVAGYCADSPFGTYVVAMRYPKCWEMTLGGERLYSGRTMKLARAAAQKDCDQRAGALHA